MAEDQGGKPTSFGANRRKGRFLAQKQGRPVGRVGPVQGEKKLAKEACEKAEQQQVIAKIEEAICEMGRSKRFPGVREVAREAGISANNFRKDPYRGILIAAQQRFVEKYPDVRVPTNRILIADASEPSRTPASDMGERSADGHLLPRETDFLRKIAYHKEEAAALRRKVETLSVPPWHRRKPQRWNHEESRRT